MSEQAIKLSRMDTIVLLKLTDKGYFVASL